MKEVVLLVGNIGTGKTTLVKSKYAKDDYIVISADELRYLIGGGIYILNRTYEPVIWKTVFTMFEGFLELKENIVVDTVNMNKDFRKKFLVLVNKHPEYKKVAVVMPRLTMKEAVDRRMQNPHDIHNREEWNEVWLRFDSLYEEPEKAEGFDSIVKM